LKFNKFLQGVNLSLTDIPNRPEDTEDSAAPAPQPVVVQHPEGLRLSDPYWFTKDPGTPTLRDASNEREIARTKLAWGFVEQLQAFVKYTVRPAGLYPALWATGFVNAKDANGNFDPELALEKCEKWFEENKANDTDRVLA
jgi:hypothetical protein